MGEHKLAAPPAALRHGQQDDQDNDHRGASPPDAQSVDLVQPPATKDIDEVGDQHDGPEHEDGLPGVGHEIIVPQGNGAKDKLGAAEVDA